MNEIWFESISDPAVAEVALSERYNGVKVPRHVVDVHFDSESFISS